MDKQWPCQVAVDLKAVGYDCRLTCCFWASNGFANMSNTMRFISLIMPKLAWDLYGLHHFIGWIWLMCHCLRLMAASCLQFHFLCERYHCYCACLSQYNSTRYTFQTMLFSYHGGSSLPFLHSQFFLYTPSLHLRGMVNPVKIKGELM